MPGFILIEIVKKLQCLSLNSNFLIPISLQRGGIKLLYLKLGFFDPAKIEILKIACCKDIEQNYVTHMQEYKFLNF